MKIGTKSLLFGVHQVIIHPICIFIAWWKLYGFPKDPRLWVAFIVHDLGYWGKSNMDGIEGETHVELGARIMHWLFDKRAYIITYSIGRTGFKKSKIYDLNKQTKWHDFTLYHSRFYAKTNNHPISKLCVADKAAFYVLPKWFYLFLATLSGEIYEYMTTSRTKVGKLPITNKNEWYNHVYAFMKVWVIEHKDNLNNN